MSVPVAAFVFVACLYLLAKIADVLLDAVTVLAKRWGLSEAVAGATVAATATSAPELGTTIAALTQGDGATADIGVGTVVGSAVFNVAVVVGEVALAGRAKLADRVISRDLGAYALSVAVLLVCVVWLGAEPRAISRVEAGAMLLGYGAYVVWIVRHVRDDRARDKGGADSEPDAESSLSAAVGKLVASVAAIGVVCHFLVLSARALVVWIGAALELPAEPVAVVASVVVIAAATSVPDAFTSLTAARRGQTSLAVSNAIGSNTFDVLICLGLPYATVGGPEIARPIVWSVGYLFGTVVLLYALTRKRELRRSHGYIFLTVYALFAALVVASSLTSVF